jgi:hypothetical protein
LHSIGKNWLFIDHPEAGERSAVTKLLSDMKLLPPYRSAVEMECPQGQRLEWWEHESESGQQWFRVAEPSEL